jgi:hypothetical protein
VWVVSLRRNLAQRPRIRFSRTCDTSKQSPETIIRVDPRLIDVCGMFTNKICYNGKKIVKDALIKSHKLYYSPMELLYTDHFGV